MMNKTVPRPACCRSILLLMTVMLALLASCENKWPRNGDLDGQWQLLSIEHDGIVTDVKDKQLYLSFQLDLCQLSTASNHIQYYCYFERTGCNFERTGRHIIFRQFSEIASLDTKTNDNLPVTAENLHLLRQWGYYSQIETFHIESLSKDDMVLRSDSARIVYRKF